MNPTTITIKPDQHFRIQVLLPSNSVRGELIREEFTGAGPESFAERMVHAERIAALYKRSSIAVRVRSEINNKNNIQ